MREYQSYITTAIETCIEEGWADPPAIHDIYGCLQYMVSRSSKIKLPRVSVEVKNEIIHYRAFSKEDLSNALAFLVDRNLIDQTDERFRLSKDFRQTQKSVAKSILHRFNRSLRKDASKIGQRISEHQRILKKFGFGEATEDLRYVDEFERAEHAYLDSFKKWT